MSDDYGVATKRIGKQWDRIANRYNKREQQQQQHNDDNETIQQHQIQVTQSYLQSTHTVLDLGCGTGTTSIKHAPYVQKIVAIDASTKMLNIAKNNVENIDGNAGWTSHVIHFEHSAIEDLQIPPRSYNVILGMNILHVVDDKEEIIRKVHDWLKPGGVFITSTPCLLDKGIPTRAVMKTVVPAVGLLGVVPKVHAFSKSTLLAAFTNESKFYIEYEWQPSSSSSSSHHHNKNSAVFIVARKI